MKVWGGSASGRVGRFATSDARLLTVEPFGLKTGPYSAPERSVELWQSESRRLLRN